MTDSVHIKFQALVEKLKAAWNRLPEEYRYPEILEVIDAVSDLPCECTDRTKMELDAVRAVEGYSSPPNIVVPEAESGPAPLLKEFFYQGYRAARDRPDLTAATAWEIMLRAPMFASAALPESWPAWQPIETAPKDGLALCSWSGGWRTVVELRTLPLMRPAPTHWMPLPAPSSAALLVPAAPQPQETKDDHARVDGILSDRPLGSTASGNEVVR